MDVARYRELQTLAERDDDAMEAFLQEIFLDPDDEARRQEESFTTWIESQAELYISEDTPPPEEAEIDKLASEIDF